MIPDKSKSLFAAKLSGFTESFFGTGKSIALCTLMRCDHFEAFDISLLASLFFALLLAECLHCLPCHGNPHFNALFAVELGRCAKVEFELD